MNIVRKYTFEILLSVLLDVYPEVRLLDRNSSFNCFLGTSTLFSKVAASFYIHNNSAQGFYFLYRLADTCYFLHIVLFFRVVAILIGVRWWDDDNFLISPYIHFVCFPHLLIVFLQDHNKFHTLHLFGTYSICFYILLFFLFYLSIRFSHSVFC